MRYHTLFTDDKSWLAAEGSVIPASDVTSVQSAIELMEALSQRLAEAEEQIAALKQEAHDQGYAEGHASGLEAAGEHNDQQLQRLQQQYALRDKERDQHSVELAIAVVKRIAGDVASDEWLTAQAVEAVASLNTPDEHVKLVVHRTQVSAVEAQVNQLKHSGNADALRIDAVQASDDENEALCRLEVCAGGSVVVDLSTQLDAIQRALRSSEDGHLAHG